MKTLYININGKDIQSTDSIEVIGSAEDNLVYGFYYSLGAEILRGVNTSSIGKITKSSLIENFKKEKPEEYKAIEVQWEKLKAVLLGENPEGKFIITLPNDYIDWFRLSDKRAHSEIYTQKFQDKKEEEVAIDVEELYEESVDLLRRKAVRFLQNNDNYKNFDQLIVNDNLVERKSKLVDDIKKKFKDVEDFDVAFVSFEKYVSQFEMNVPLIMEEKEKTKEDEKESTLLLNQLFPLYGVKLGETSPEAIERKGKNLEWEDDSVVYRPEEGVSFVQSHCLGSNSFCWCEVNNTHTIPNKWESLNLRWGYNK